MADTAVAFTPAYKLANFISPKGALPKCTEQCRYQVSIRACTTVDNEAYSRYSLLPNCCIMVWYNLGDGWGLNPLVGC